MKYLGPILIGIVVCAIVYCVYWVFKSGSYTFFYEGMVEDTIRNMVKESSLQ